MVSSIIVVNFAEESGMEQAWLHGTVVSHMPDSGLAMLQKAVVTKNFKMVLLILELFEAGSGAALASSFFPASTVTVESGNQG